MEIGTRKDNSIKLSSACKECQKPYKKKYSNDNKLKIREQTRLHKQSPHGRFLRTKHDAKQRKILFELNENEFLILINNPCYYCDNKLGTKTSYGCGLDRIDSKLGYTINNVVPCCHFCNIIKSYLLSSDEMIKVAQLIINERLHQVPTDSINLKRQISHN